MKRKYLQYTLAVLIIAITMIVVNALSHTPLQAYEGLSFMLFPSAERAFEDGERHFNAQHPKLYDIDRAEFFFRKAESLDPKLPYIHHELARIAFLHGAFDIAMAQINLQIAQEGDRTPNSFYIRGLIEGFRGDYSEAANDYKYYLRFDPRNWAAINDYSWVLLKAGRTQEALDATQIGLGYFPNNAWLLNSNATALYELGDYPQARIQMQKVLIAVSKLTEKDWLTAYPGNDPAIAGDGLMSFQRAAFHNTHAMQATSTPGALQR